MADRLIKTETLQDIADAIRAKRETTSAIRPSAFASEIRSIEVTDPIEAYDDAVTVDETATPTFTDDYSEGYTDGYEEGSANGGGSVVTIEGEVVPSFPADTYIAEKIAALVNSAPSTLDTLAEIATALGNDPNFATTIIAALGNKVDKVTTPSNASSAYTVGLNGEQTLTSITTSANAYTIVLRRSGGRIDAGRATDDANAVPLAQLNEIITEQIGDIAAALDEVHAYAEALKGGATV